MAFPTSPVDGQIVTINNIVYQYSTASNSWTRIPAGFVNINASGNISATGNIIGNYILGNGSQLTGLPAGYANANVVSYAEAGWAGNIIPSANVTYSLGNATNQWASVYVGANTLYINSVAVTVNGNTLVVANANVVTQSSNGIISGGNISVTGNITGGYFIGNGSQLTSIPTLSDLSNTNSNVSNNSSNITTLQGQVYTNANVAAYLPTYTGNITASNISASGNIIAANVLAVTDASASGNVIGTYFIGDGSKLTGIAPTVQIYEFANVITTGGYYQATWLANYVAGTATSVTQTVTTTPTLLASFLTQSGYPNITTIPVGTIAVTFETQKASGPQGYYTYAEIWKRTSGGVETLLNTTDNTSTITQNGLVQQVLTDFVATPISLSATDRILIKVYAVMTSGSASISITFDNNTNSGLQLPALPASASQFVPYDNPTANVNLGGYGLTGTFVSVTGNVYTSNTVINNGLSTSGNVTAGNIVTANTVINNSISTTGNITGNYIIGNGSLLTNINASNINGAYGNSNVASYLPTYTGNLTAGNVSVTGALQTANITLSGDIITGSGPTLTIDPNGAGGTDGNVVITGNLTVQGTTTTINSNTVTTNDLQINMANNAANSTAANNGGIGVGPAGAEYATLLYNTASNVWVSNLGISSVANVSANNLSANTIAGTLSTAAQTNITSVGTLSSLNSGAISSSGNVTGANILTGGIISATGNATAGNLITAGAVLMSGVTELYASATGNDIIGNAKTTGQLVIGGASQTGQISIGQSNQNQTIRIASGVTSSGNAKSILIGQNGGAGSSTTISLGPNSGGTGTVTIAGATTLQIANVGNAALSIAGNITGPAQFNINMGGAISASGNVTASNMLTAGIISSTGNAIHGNILTAGLISSTGNITSGNVLTAGVVSSTANITGGNILTAGLISATSTITSAANIIGGNVTTVGLISATGNVTGNYFIGNGSTLSSITGSNVTGTVANATFATSAGTATSATTAGTVTTNAQPNITSVGTLTTLSVTGNTQSGNLLTAGYVSATGNITGNYIIGNGSQLTGLPASYSNTNVASYLSSGTVSTNILTTAAISATGNVTGNYFIGNGSQLTSLISWTTQANTAPTGIVPGSFWYDSYSGVKYQYTNDGTSNVWIDQSFPTSFSTLAVTGNATIGGNLGVSGTFTANTISYANVASPGYVSAVGNITGGNLSVSTGTITVGNIVNGNGNAVGNIGSSSNYFNRIFATATTALYADLAEMYTADQDYIPGTVVEFGGSQEIRASQLTHSTSVAGIISTNPSYLMNAAQPGEYVLPVALTGRVPCLVVGTIRKGDRLVASEISGVATVLDISKYEPSCIIGKALANYDSIEPGIIEVAVGRT